MTEPIEVPSAGEPEWKGEITESKLDDILSGLLVPNQAYSKAMASALRQRDERIAELEAKLAEISGWCDAYPLDFAGGIFNEPDMGEVQRLLGNDLLTKLSASNYRHVLNGIKRIIEEKS